MDLVVLKLQFEVKNWYMHTNLETVAQQPGMPLWDRVSVWRCFIPFFFHFKPSLNFLKFHLNSCLPLP